MYCILRLRASGELSHMLLEDEKQAYLYYYKACQYNPYEDSFIALFEKAVMLSNNQERRFTNESNWC